MWNLRQPRLKGRKEHPETKQLREQLHNGSTHALNIFTVDFGNLNLQGKEERFELSGLRVTGS